jgi:hypothetical protein
VAKVHPQLLESLIVRSYSNHLPGQICKTWPHYQSGEEITGEVAVTRPTIVQAALLGWTLAAQVCLTVPYLYQRILLRFVQPVIFSAISVVWFGIIRSPVAMAAVGAAIGVCALLAAWRMHAQVQSARQSSILPVVAEPGVKDVLPVETLLHEDSEDNQDSSAPSLSSQNEESVQVGEESHYDDGGAERDRKGAGEIFRPELAAEELGIKEEDKPGESGDDDIIAPNMSTPSKLSPYAFEHQSEALAEGESDKGSTAGSGKSAESQRSGREVLECSVGGQRDVGSKSGGSSGGRTVTQTSKQATNGAVLNRAHQTVVAPTSMVTVFSAVRTLVAAADNTAIRTTQS